MVEAVIPGVTRAMTVWSPAAERAYRPSDRQAAANCVCPDYGLSVAPATSAPQSHSRHTVHCVCVCVYTTETTATSTQETTINCNVEMSFFTARDVTWC